MPWKGLRGYSSSPPCPEHGWAYRDTSVRRSCIYMPAYEEQEAIIDNRREVSVCLIPKTRIGESMSITLQKSPRSPRTTAEVRAIIAAKRAAIAGCALEHAENISAEIAGMFQEAVARQRIEYEGGAYVVYAHHSKESAERDSRWMLKNREATKVARIWVDGKEVTL